MTSPNAHDQGRIPISHLQPSVVAENTSIVGVVTLVWPYSSSNKSFSLLLVEPDFRLRQERGQVRVHFRGSSAGAVARCGISIGDEVTLGLVGALWATDDTISKTPGRGIDWELQFRERLILTRSRISQEPVFLEIDHPILPDELENSAPATPRMSNPSHSTPTPRLNLGSKPQTWSSPVFLKRSQLPYAMYFRTQYDSSLDERVFEDSGRNKKLRFGRNSNQWAFTDVLPSSSKGHSDGPSPENSKSVSPAPAELEKGRSSPFENITSPTEFELTPPIINAEGPASPVKSSLVEIRHTTPIINAQEEDSPVEIRHTTPIINTQEEYSPVEIRHTMPSTNTQEDESPDKIGHTTPITNTQEEDSPVEVGHTTPITNTQEEDSSIEISHTTPITNTQEEDSPVAIRHTTPITNNFGEVFSVGNDADPSKSEAPQTEQNTFVIAANAPKLRSNQSSPMPNLVNFDNVISQFTTENVYNERSVSTTWWKLSEQAQNIIELSSGDSEGGEDDENEEIPDDEESEDDGDDGDDEDDEDEDDEDEDDEEEEYSDEDDIDDKDSESSPRTFSRGHHHPSEDPRFPNPPSMALYPDFEGQESDLNDGSSRDEWASSSELPSIVTESDGDSSENQSGGDSLAVLTCSDNGFDRVISEHELFARSNRTSESPERDSHLTEERRESGFNPVSTPKALNQLEVASDGAEVNTRFDENQKSPEQSGNTTFPVLGENQPIEDAKEEDIENTSAISICSSPSSNKPKFGVTFRAQLRTSKLTEDTRHLLLQDQVVEEVGEGDQLSSYEETSKIEIEQSYNISQNQLFSLPRDNDSFLSSVADVGSEGELKVKQGVSEWRRDSESPELENSPPDEQPSNERLLQENDCDNGPELHISTLSEHTAEKPTGFFEQPETALMDRETGCEIGKLLGQEQAEIHERNPAIENLVDSESSDGHPNPKQLDFLEDGTEAAVSEHQQLNNPDVSIQTELAAFSHGLETIRSIEADKKVESVPSNKPAVEIIDLESEDGDYEAETWVKEERLPGPVGANPQYITRSDLTPSVAHPGTQIGSQDVFTNDGHSQAVCHETGLSAENNEENKPDIPSISNSNPENFEDSPIKENLPGARSPSPHAQNADLLSKPIILTTGEEVLDELDDELIFGKQLATPKATQQRIIVLESSPMSPQPIEEQNSLLTPHLTQNTSTSLPPIVPEPPSKQTVIEKLKAMKSLSAEAARARTSNILNAVGPWFVQKKESQMTHVSDSENEVASDVEAETLPSQYDIIYESDEDQDEVELDEEGLDEGGLDEEGLDEMELDEDELGDSDQSEIQRDEVEQDEVELEGNEQDREDRYVIEHERDDSLDRAPTPINVPFTLPTTSPTLAAQHPGFRTSFSYFAPLSTISNHFNELVDTLVIVLSSTRITSAQGGPRHWNQTISIIDPSSSSSFPDPVVTVAQIFRRYKSAFPSVRQGDAILLRDFKVQSFQNRLGLLSTDSSAWAVFRKGIDVQIRGPPVEFGAEERGFARGLWDWWGSVGEEVRKGMGETAAAAGRASSADSPEQGETKMSAEADDDEEDGGEIVTPTKSGRSKGRRRGRPPLGHGVVRHELRDGSSYTDSPHRGKGSVHELRDGTTYSDSIEP